MKLKKFFDQFWRHLILIIFSILAVGPIAWILIGSLKSNEEILAGALKLPTTLHFENFASVWLEANFKTYILNSIIVCAISTLIVMSYARKQSNMKILIKPEKEFHYQKNTKKKAWLIHGFSKKLD